MIKIRAFQVFIFLLPTQLSLHFWFPFSYVWGIRVDYLAPAIYFTDVLLFIIFAGGFRNRVVLQWVFKKYKFYLLLLIAFSAVSIFSSTAPMLSAYRWLKVGEFLGLFLLLKTNGSLYDKIRTPLSLSLFCLFLLSSAQVVLGGSIGGALYWVGERSIDTNTVGAALASVFGNEIFRPYATFGHPNTLAGYSLLGLLLVGLGKSKLQILGLASGVFLIILSFSQNAWIALLLIGVLALLKPSIKHVKKIVYILVGASLMLATLEYKGWEHTSFVYERLVLNSAAGEILSENVLIGAGLGTFTAVLPQIESASRATWLLQPPHNIFLLVASEIGLIGLVLFTFFITKNINKQNAAMVAAIIFTGLFDHYWITQQQTFLLAAIALGIKSVKITDENIL